MELGRESIKNIIRPITNIIRTVTYSRVGRLHKERAIWNKKLPGDLSFSYLRTVNRKIIARHAVCWLLYLAYSLIDSSLSGKSYPDKPFFLSYYWDFTYWVTQIVQFYFCYLWVFPKFLNKGKPFRLIGGIVLALLVFQVVRILLEQVLGPYVVGRTNYSGDNYIPWMISTNFYFGTWMVGIAGAIYAAEHAFKQEKRNTQLKAEATKAELAFLKNQINPHFLYNSLNYIYSQALPLSASLSEAILRLSDMMRYTLSESKDGLVSLGKEVEYMNSYLALLRMRFDPQFFMRFETVAIDGDIRIPPLLLIPFVENAFKHGQFDRAEYPVKIKLSLVDNHLTLVTENKIRHDETDYGSGIGLANVKRRLELIYPGQYTLEISDDGNIYRVFLEIRL